jgi:hypothetical protein
VNVAVKATLWLIMATVIPVDIAVSLGTSAFRRASLNSSSQTIMLQHGSDLS